MQNTKRTLFIGITLLFFVSFGKMASPQTVKQEDVLGTWFNQEKDAKIQIFKEGSKFTGKIVWLKDPVDPATHKPKVDDKNPQAALRNRGIIGLVIMKAFVFDDGQWVDGSIYDPDNGKTYNCKMTLQGPNVLDVRGYIGYSWMGLGRTAVWTRAK